ncbi:MAG TPA: hypothetical protein VHV75_12870 [Solirubrobacteraceae bacterium]|jgi:hypothetical protein|nr:hypothetical protein [Solirubrobacteraceae bacterium]
MSRRLLTLTTLTLFVAVCGALLVAREGGAGGQSLLGTLSAGGARCNLDATPSNFKQRVAAASPGQTVCLAGGNYGNWSGTSKASPGITITTRPGAAVRLGFQFSLANTQNFTVDGSANGGSISTPNEGMQLSGNTNTPRNITIQNVSFSGNEIDVDIDGPTNSNITFNHDLFDGSDCLGGGIDIHIEYSPNAPSGVTVENSIIENGSSDGIQSGAAMKIVNNYFYKVIESNRSELSQCHTDAIQFVGMTGGQTTIEGNWFVDTADGIGSWNGDNAPGYLIENNVFDHQVEESAIVLHLDKGSRVIHNTCIDASDACIDLTGTSYQPSVGTVIKDNIFDARYPYDLTYADPARRIDNMVRARAGDSDFDGIPRFVGGTNVPFTSRADYLLTSRSPGHNRADDGTDVGAVSLNRIAYGPQASEVNPFVWPFPPVADLQTCLASIWCQQSGGSGQ